MLLQVEAQEEAGEPGGSPAGEPVLGGRVGRQRSPFAQSCAERPASHRKAGATPTAGLAWGLPLRVWAGVRRARRQQLGRRSPRHGRRVPA